MFASPVHPRSFGTALRVAKRIIVSLCSVLSDANIVEATDRKDS